TAALDEGFGGGFGDVGEHGFHDDADGLVGGDAALGHAEVGDGDRGHRHGDGGGAEAERHDAALQAEALEDEFFSGAGFRGGLVGGFVGGAAGGLGEVVLDLFLQDADVGGAQVGFVGEGGAVDEDLVDHDGFAEQGGRLEVEANL